MNVRLGTRSSRLALWQSERVAALLREQGAECEIVRIETKGDDIPDRPLPEIGGDGVFTERIERALRERTIDIAVHSLKDLPVEDPRDLFVGAVPARDDVREVLISRGGRLLADLPAGAVIGSSSTRRQAQLLAVRPDLVVRPIRGNVETRIRKVESGDYDATLLAAAGVLRLGLSAKITQWLPVSDFLPAPGQGAIAVQCRRDDEAVCALLARIDDTAVRAATDAERGFLKALGGGCSAPVGALAKREGAGLRLKGRIAALDGSRLIDVEGEGQDGAALAAGLAARALSEGARELISAARVASHAPNAVPDTSASGPLAGRRVVVTRPREQSAELCALLAAAGAIPVPAAMIRTLPLEDTGSLDEAISRLDSYTWLVFTSTNGVRYFMDRLDAVCAAWPPGMPRVAAVGPGTASALSRNSVAVHLVPTSHTGAALGMELAARIASGDRILMPGALEGREEAAQILRAHGARVHDIPVYRTEPCAPSRDELAALAPGADAVLFTSGSAVRSWCTQAGSAEHGAMLADIARTAVVACIGPSTTETARANGFRVDVEAEVHTLEGLVSALAGHYEARGEPAVLAARAGRVHA